MENNDDVEEEEEGVQRKYFRMHADDFQAIVTDKLEATEKQGNTWGRISNEVQVLCVKTITRLILMKGTRKEAVTRTHISESLGKLDKEYRKHVDIVMTLAQASLEANFGYTVTSGDEVRGLKDEDGKKEDYYVFNMLQSSKLQDILSERNSEEAAFNGFCFVIFQILFTSPGKEAELKAIYKKVRDVDSRFPETLLEKSKSTSQKKACPIPELKDDFLGLISKMRRWIFLCGVVLQYGLFYYALFY